MSGGRKQTSHPEGERKKVSGLEQRRNNRRQDSGFIPIMTSFWCNITTPFNLQFY